MADLAALAPPSSSPYSPNPANPAPQNPSQNPLPSPLTSSAARQWRPAAQRNLRNQWSKLASHIQQWASSSSAARSHATILVNAFLSLKYMPSMELGVLTDMPDLRKKACQKLSQLQELHRRKLLASYKDMVLVVTEMVRTSRSMRCFLKGTSNSPLEHYIGYSEDKIDPGDGGGIPVFTFWSISCFEKVAEELVLMLISELNLKRLLVVELLSVSCKVPAVNTMHWPVYPRLDDQQPDMPATQCNQQPDYDVLQVYLATWLAEVNVDAHRVDEIYAEVGKEMHVKLS
ncbi:hypothetical protein ACFX1T_015576 [Malus domestica]